MNNKLTAIRTFLHVASAGSFSAAARQSGMKQSAVSQQIAALEAELGVVLFYRTTRVMTLTAQGEQYRQQIQPLLNAMQEVEDRLQPEQHAFQGKVSIQLPGGIGRFFLPSLLALQAANPELHLTISLEDRISDLVREGVDVALRLSAEPPDALAARMLARVETPLFAAPDFAPISSLEELGERPHVRFSGIGLAAPLRLISGANSVEVAVNTVFRASSSEALLLAIEAGIGVGGLQLPLAAKALQQKTIVQSLPAWRLPDRFLYAIFPDARFIPPRVRRVVEIIEAQLPGLTGIFPV
ncbi:LysR substrate-binding domain-containing protein [Enterobacteriaceae bacterium C23F]